MDVLMGGVLSTEMVRGRENDVRVKALTKEFESIVSVIKKVSNGGNKLIKQPLPRSVNVAMQRIDDIVKDGFGIPIKHVYKQGTPYGVLTTPPTGVNAINKDLIQTHDEANLHYGNKTDTESLDGADIDDIVDLDGNEEKIYNKYVESIARMNKAVGGGVVRVDNKTARITGIPKGVRVTVISDFFLLVNTCKLTGEELTAILLHEIGHAYTHIEYSIRSVRNTQVILDSISEYTATSTRGVDGMLSKLNKDLGGDDTELNGMTQVTAIGRVMDRYMKTSLSMSDSTHSITDSEQLADQFATRFGMGVSLAEALVKLTTAGVKIERDTLYTFLLINIFYSGLYGIFLGIGVIGGITVGVMAMALAYCVILITQGVIAALTAGGAKTGVAYDSGDRRLRRIRNDVIRQIRLGYIDKRDAKAQLANIKLLEKLERELIAVTPFSTKTVIDDFFKTLTTSGRAITDMKLTEQFIEDMMENKLHVLSQGMKQLGK